jgi:hypothetical protein
MGNPVRKLGKLQYIKKNVVAKLPTEWFQGESRFWPIVIQKAGMAEHQQDIIDAIYTTIERWPVHLWR